MQEEREVSKMNGGGEKEGRLPKIEAQIKDRDPKCLMKEGERDTRTNMSATAARTKLNYLIID